MVLGWILSARFGESCGLVREAESELWGVGLPQIGGLVWRELDLALVGRLFRGSYVYIGAGARYGGFTWYPGEWVADLELVLIRGG